MSITISCIVSSKRIHNCNCNRSKLLYIIPFSSLGFEFLCKVENCLYLWQVVNGLVTLHGNGTRTGTGTKWKVHYAVEMFTLVREGQGPGPFASYSASTAPCTSPGVTFSNTPCLIAPLPYIGMHPVISHKFTGFKQNPINVQEIYKMHAHVK